MTKCKLKMAYEEIGHCCQTLCDRSIVKASLPSITKEHALSLVDKKTYYDYSTHEPIILVEDVKDILSAIYG